LLEPHNRLLGEGVKADSLVKASGRASSSAHGTALTSPFGGARGTCFDGGVHLSLSAVMVGDVEMEVKWLRRMGKEGW
jgi:hypothetical protein